MYMHIYIASEKQRVRLEAAETSRNAAVTSCIRIHHIIAFYYICISYIYIYTYRERVTRTHMYICIYIMYIHVYMYKCI